MKKKKIIFLTIIVTIILASSTYFFFENSTLEKTTYEILNDKVNSELKIAQISDFHNTKLNRLKEKIINELKSENPDVIMITGDIIDSRREDIDVSLNFIKKIKDIAPIYYVNGNHEIRSNNYDELKEGLISNEVNVLENKASIFNKDDTTINIIGINDPSYVHDNYIDDKDIVNKVLDDITYDSNLYTILLSHRPELFDTYKEKNIDLVLTGHAHGGQIRLFNKGLVAPNQGLFPKYTSGIFLCNNTSMITSRGIGNSVLPFRINNNPELVIIKIKKGD